MSNSQECRDRAAQCFRLASTATTPLQRITMLNAATTWIALANRADRDLTPRNLQDHRDQALCSRTLA